jgi:hypothetical protein
MGRNRGPAYEKKKAASDALRQVIADPGSHLDMWNDLAIDKDGKPIHAVAHALISPHYTDRDAALIYGSMLEQALETAIASHFVVPKEETAGFFSYDDEGGGFTDFAIKVKLGYALGIYDSRMRGDLGVVRMVRNAFAHARVAINFTTPAVAQACELIQARNFASSVAGPPARQRYVSAAALSSFYLVGARQTTPRQFTGSPFYEPIYKPPAT